MTEDRAALEILLKVTKEDAYLNLALKEGLAGFDSNSAGRVTAAVFNTVEHIGYCDYLIAHYAKGRVHTSIRGILRLAIAKMFYMNEPDHAVCSRAVDLTAEIGKSQLKGFVNGVLRNAARDRKNGSLPPLPKDFVERMFVLSGYPEFMIREYADLYGEAFAEDLLTAKEAPTAVRAVPPCSTEEVEKLFAETGAVTERSRIVPGAILVKSFKGSIADDELFTEGRITIQSEGAMLACICLEPEPGMNILDSCAAPGGKTALIYDLMNRDGRVTAWDVHPHRVGLIKNTLSRLGIQNVNCEVRDASVPDESLAGSFDRVLCDVPCSGLGGGSKPDARLRRTKESVDELSKLQGRILDACSNYVKPGGLLVYSTCTVSMRENELAVKGFLDRQKEFELFPFSDLLPENLRDRAENGMLQLFPNTDGTEGFFIARLRRKY